MHPFLTNYETGQVKIGQLQPKWVTSLLFVYITMNFLTYFPLALPFVKAFAEWRPTQVLKMKMEALSMPNAEQEHET